MPEYSNGNEESMKALLFAANNTGTDVRYLSAPSYANLEDNLIMYCVFPNDNLAQGISLGNAVFKFVIGDYEFLYLGGANETELKY